MSLGSYNEITSPFKKKLMIRVIDPSSLLPINPPVASRCQKVVDERRGPSNSIFLPSLPNQPTRCLIPPQVLSTKLQPLHQSQRIESLETDKATLPQFLPARLNPSQAFSPPRRQHLPPSTAQGVMLLPVCSAFWCFESQTSHLDVAMNLAGDWERALGMGHSTGFQGWVWRSKPCP